MVINCPECSTKFRVATEKIPAKGAKLRCAKCSHIFFVKPEEETPAAPAVEVAEPQPPEETPAAPQEPAGAAEGDSFGFGESPAESDFGFEEAPGAGDFAAEESAAEMADPFSDSDFDLGGSTPDAEAPGDDFGFEEPPSAAADSPDRVDFGFEEDAPSAETEKPSVEGPADDFGFEEDKPAAEIGMGTNDEFDPTAFDMEDSAEGDDFSFDEDYGNLEIGSDNDQSFSFGDEDEDEKEQAADNFAAEQSSAAEEEITTEEAAAGFEEEAPIAQESFEEHPPTEPYAPLDSDDYSEQELPANIQASKKRSPFATLTLFLLVLILAIVVAGGVLYWQSGPEAIQQLYQRITGQESSVPVKGQILVKNLQGSFVSNKSAGELLVIQGKAVNNFRESRAAIQVKGILFDNQGNQLRQKTIFCGNPISPEDLRSLPFDKLEEIMGNQFGESLVNLNVTPGQVISFTIVFRDIPENLSEFVVEVAGSNPAAQ